MALSKMLNIKQSKQDRNDLTVLSPSSVTEHEDKKRSKLDVKAPPRWKGGGLYDWKRWVRTFLDIAE